MSSGNIFIVSFARRILFISVLGILMFRVRLIVSGYLLWNLLILFVFVVGMLVFRARLIVSSYN